MDEQVQNLINEFKELVSNGKIQAAQNLCDDASLFVEKGVALTPFYSEAFGVLAVENAALRTELAAAMTEIASQNMTIKTLSEHIVNSIDDGEEWLESYAGTGKDETYIHAKGFKTDAAANAWHAMTGE